ncbi:MAG: hypothetical protein LBG58_08940 [Planctomycetaceae bacterium]|nr:hypothetical protein [Planctomycetaceae bacterium]
MSTRKKQSQYVWLEVVSGVLSLLGTLSFVVFSLTTFTGCGLLESRKKPRIEEVPPYYQQGGFSPEFQSYHDRERENMSQQVHIVRNREMERLANAENEEKKERQWEEEIKTTQEKREIFWNKFKINDKITDKNFLRSDEAARISSNLDR